MAEIRHREILSDYEIIAATDHWRVPRRKCSEFVTYDDEQKKVQEVGTS